jgi:FG-GAP repeat protein
VLSRRSGLAGLAIAAGLVAVPAAAPAQADLPRTYQVQRIENPTPEANERFGDGLVNGGDVNGDGEDDLLVGIDEHATITGEVFVFSGADGSLIRRIPPPDPDAGQADTNPDQNITNPDNPDAFGTFVGKMADIGSCPGFTGDPGDDCTATPVAIDTTLDGRPEHLASAVGVDINQADGDDMGMVYVLDGATGAVLKRIRMPGADRTEQAENSPNASQGPAFGRTVLSPSGQPPCEGFGGARFDIGGVDQNPCAYLPGSAVARGDVDGGGKPDIGVGASDFTDGTAGVDAGDPAANPNCMTTNCFQTGRYFVYRGEDLAGLMPATPLESTLYTIENPAVQDDLATINSRFHREAMGYSVAPVGDLGACANTAPIAPADDPDSYYCMNAPANTTAPDGRPEIVVSSHRVDANGLGDVGMAFVIDGRSGRILDVLNHPQPQQTSIFAFSNYNQPALGDAGSNTTPDIYQGAMIHDVVFRAQGRGWVLNGDFRFGGANHYEIAQLDDPTPGKIGNFSTSSAGVGNVAGDLRNELAIGAYGPHAPQVVENVISDVHIFSPLTEQVLQTISDPDQQPGAGFGRALAPMGDLNNDGFLDFAVGAGGFDPGQVVTCSPCTGGPNPGQGRIYLLRSDNSPPPPGLAGPAGGGGGGAGPAAVVLAGRSVSLAASKNRVRAGRRARVRRVRLSGVVEAFSNEAQCVPRQRVQLQRRRPGRPRYRTFARRTTDRRGGFSARFRPRRTYVYRARVGQTASCHGAVSESERVTVTRKKRSSRRRR